MKGHTELPWCIPDGDGNEHLICAGNDPSKPGRILLVLNGAGGTRDNLSYEEISECNQRIVTAVNTSPAVTELVEALEAIVDLQGKAAGGFPLSENEFREWAVANHAARAALSHYRELAGTSNEVAK